MTQYFYTDPLAAAWMAKHFQMTFIHPYSGKAYSEESIASWEISRINVHPDSLPLLEPKAGDWVSVFSGKISAGSWPDEIAAVYTQNDEGYPYVGDGRDVYLLDSIHPDYTYADRLGVIRRNGTAFHWPEMER